MTAEPPFHLTDRVKLDLLRLIEADNLKPGDKVPPADQLCLRFSVSRTVVREAIASLKAEGRLRSLRGSGVYVSKPHDTVGASSMFMAAPQEIGDVLDFMEFRIGVEVEAARLAAERRTETNLLRMEQALAQFRRHLNDKSLATDADRAFHRVVDRTVGCSGRAPAGPEGHRRPQAGRGACRHASASGGRSAPLS